MWRRLMDGLGGRRRRTPDFLAEALELEASGDYPNALTSYRLALRERPDDLRVLQNLAIAYSRAGQPEEAIRAYRRALALDHTLAGAHYGLAFLLLKRGEGAEAVEHLEAFLELPVGDDEGSGRFRAHAMRTLHAVRHPPPDNEGADTTADDGGA